jgi:hypothetical protein
MEYGSFQLTAKSPGLLTLPWPLRRGLSLVPRRSVSCRPAYRDGRVRLNRRGFSFAGIEPEVWDYRIGAYQVLPRWLRKRKGRVLTWNESRGFRQTVEALRRTLTVQAQLAEVCG